jgi:hypothetical protein
VLCLSFYLALPSITSENLIARYLVGLRKLDGGQWIINALDFNV